MPRLLIVSTIRWGYLWQRHQALATAAAEAGWQVDFLQPRPRNLRQVASYPMRRVRGTRLEQDHGSPPEGVRILGSRAWLRGLPPGYDLALVYIPDRLTEWLLARSRPRAVVYDAVLDWATVPADWYPPIGWRSAERRLAHRADTVVTTDAAGMVEVLTERGIASTVVPPAADPVFVTAGSARPAKRPAALYFGSVRAEVDVPVITAVAAAGVPVEVIGRVEDPALGDQLTAGGVTVRAALPVEAIARAAAEYQVLLLPYRGARSESLVPAKYWNCVATGSWVVTSGLAEIDASPNVRRSDGTQAGFVELVRESLASPPPAAAVPTWGERWNQLLALVAASAAEQPVLPGQDDDGQPVA